MIGTLVSLVVVLVVQLILLIASWIVWSQLSELKNRQSALWECLQEMMKLYSSELKKVNELIEKFNNWEKK